MIILKHKSEALEQKAMGYESGVGKNEVVTQNEVNKLYLDSIKAKMAMIE